MQFLRFDIEPVPASRPRFVGMEFGGRAYTSKKYENFKKAMKRAIDTMSIQKMEGALSVSVVFYMPIPASMSKKKRETLNEQWSQKGGDIDNLAKSVLDSLNVHAYEDDKQIVRLVLSKRYSLEPRIEVTIEDANEKG